MSFLLGLVVGVAVGALVPVVNKWVHKQADDATKKL